MKHLPEYTYGSRVVANRREQARHPKAPRALTTHERSDLSHLDQASDNSVGGEVSQATFEHHSALLSDPRMSHSMYARQRDEIVRRIGRDHGNRYVQRLVDHIRRKRTRGMRTKLTVGPAGDTYEREADRIAKQVVGVRDVSAQRAVQRQPEEEEKLQMKTLRRQDEVEDELQMRSLQQEVGIEGGNVGPDVAQSIKRARGKGQALPDNVRAPMENVIGADFSGVRVHTGADASALNDSMGARAFTTGQDIFFRKGEYSPETSGGRETLAHELTHVVQQNGSGVSPTRMVERDWIQRATKPQSGYFSKERSLTKRIEAAVRKKDRNAVSKNSLTLFKRNSTYYLDLLQYEVETRKGVDQANLDLYTKNTPGLPALREAWKKRGRYTQLIEQIATLMPFADDKVDLARQDPAFFMNHVLAVLRADKGSTSQFLQMLEIGELRDVLRADDSDAWQEFTADIPQIAVSEGVHEEVKGLDLTTEQIIDRIFDAIVQNKMIDVGYYTNNLRLDSVATILRGATPEEKAARLERNRKDATKPVKPSAQCDNLMKILQKSIEAYPGLKTTFAIGMEKKALLTVPLNTLSGGLIPNTFKGNVVDANDSYTNQIFFTGVTQSEEPRSHTWNIVGGKTYDSVLGTKGAQVAASKEGAFTQRKNDQGKWEDVWVNGNKTLTKLSKGVKTAAPNSLGFSTAYKRNW